MHDDYPPKCGIRLAIHLSDVQRVPKKLHQATSRSVTFRIKMFEACIDSDSLT
ncbi:hypothetical protein K788_0001343 (plasmid) [Paraburkholderia caribensis MBA4]|uniref:Uncharacterized protein n=1 Tax=Paraburkholderia caribensis MBA4 TaxID=1323664 RepID=A0A0P0RNG3_9BURK|nr:hypothetical protein K788_0001343 [Paraburkholderia caribensis MBA4]